MASVNTANQVALRTDEGAPVSFTTPEQALRRSVLSCLLWEDTFYEGGEAITERIQMLTEKCSKEFISNLASEAKNEFHLRHIPLFLCVCLAEQRKLQAETLEEVIQRPDEITEFLALYWKDGKRPIPAQAKKALANSLTSFNAYQLGKYNRTKKAVTLKDVICLTHPQPLTVEQKRVFKAILNGNLETPDTWEVSLSAKDGISKKEKWTRLLDDNKLGALALLRNLRNFSKEGVDESLVHWRLTTANYSRVLPFRFIAAAKAAPEYEESIEEALFGKLSEMPKFSGTTAILVDVSGSMTDDLSSRSDMTRMDAACGLAICLKQLCQNTVIFSFSDTVVRVPSRRGMALRDAILNSQEWRMTYLGEAVKFINTAVKHDRLIVITDEQSYDYVPPPREKGCIINVAPYNNGRGIGYGAWLRINGFSEAIITYLQEAEKEGIWI